MIRDFLVGLAIAAGTAAVLAACEETKRQLTKPARHPAKPFARTKKLPTPSKS